MFNNTKLKQNIKALDLEIGRHVEELSKITDDGEYEMKLQKIEELTKYRVQLMDSKVKDSIKGAVVSGGIYLGAILLTLHFEKTDVITSKAFGMISGIIKRS